MATKQRKKKNPAAQALGALGARATNSKLTPEQRSANASKAATERWKQHYEEKEGKQR